MSKTMDTSQWIQFFRKAGLPPNVAANYALIFSDNRIQVDMLLDLSKEYLYDMDIKVMGDVIAILKFAKEFHNQLAKEKIIGNTAIVPNKTAVAERMVGRYTRPVVPSPVRVPVVQAERGFQKKSTVISLKRKAGDESPIKKPRRVPPEEEGGYKIKMPLGITERTRKILQQQQQLQQGIKRSVFSRLGDSAVSSSTDSKVSSSVFERLGPTSKNICDDTPSSTVVERSTKKGAPLQYRGVLKMTVGKNRTVTTSSPKKVATTRTVIKPVVQQRPIVTKTIKLNQINTILQANKSPGSKMLRTANSTGSQGIFGQRTQKLNVKSRLGGKIDARNMTRTMIMHSKNKAPIKSSSNVFDRLGR